PERARAFANDRSAELEIDVSVAADPAAAVSGADVCVTCTPSRTAFVRRDWLPPGTFLAAVGADSHDTQELDAEGLASSKVVADIVDQCATIGELHHPLAQGLMTRENVHAELGQIVAGRRPGRESAGEIIVFD